MMPLDEQSSYMKSVIDTMMDGLMVIDPQGTIVSVNRAMESLTGYSKGELIGKDCAIIACDICFRSSHGSPVKKCVLFEKGEVFRQRCTLKRKEIDLSTLKLFSEPIVKYHTMNYLNGKVKAIPAVCEI